MSSTLVAPAKKLSDNANNNRDASQAEQTYDRKPINIVNYFISHHFNIGNLILTEFDNVIAEYLHLQSVMLAA